MKTMRGRRSRPATTSETRPAASTMARVSMTSRADTGWILLCADDGCAARAGRERSSRDPLLPAAAGAGHHHPPDARRLPLPDRHRAPRAGAPPTLEVVGLVALPRLPDPFHRLPRPPSLCCLPTLAASPRLGAPFAIGPSGGSCCW